jgi:hypothetical protein
VKAQKLELVRQGFRAQGPCSSSWMTFVLLLPDRHAESCQLRFAAAESRPRLSGRNGDPGSDANDGIVTHGDRRPVHAQRAYGYWAG